MPYRSNGNGTMSRVSIHSSPRQEGMGCTSCGPRGMGALSNQLKVSLAAGAASGARAASYALEAAGALHEGVRATQGTQATQSKQVVQPGARPTGKISLRGRPDLGSSTVKLSTRGAQGMGWLLDHQGADGVWYDANGIAFDGKREGLHFGDDVPVTAPAQTAAARSYQGSSAPAPASQEQSTFSSIWSTLFGSSQPGQGVVGNLAGQGINAYKQFTGQGQPIVVQSSGPSAAVVLGVLGVVTALGIGVAFAISSRGPRRANPRRRSAARPRYYALARRAA